MWKVKSSKIRGTGVFANKNIAKKTKVIRYICEKITKKEGDKRMARRIKEFLNL